VLLNSYTTATSLLGYTPVLLSRTTATAVVGGAGWIAFDWSHIVA
jgi:hypothetical protein